MNVTENYLATYDILIYLAGLGDMFLSRYGNWLVMGEKIMIIHR